MKYDSLKNDCVGGYLYNIHQINHCSMHEVVNIFLSSCVHIFIHLERGDELLIRGTIKERSLGTDSGSVSLF